MMIVKFSLMPGVNQYNVALGRVCSTIPAIEPGPSGPIVTAIVDELTVPQQGQFVVLRAGEKFPADLDIGHCIGTDGQGNYVFTNQLGK